MKQTGSWLSPLPQSCDICSRKISEVSVFIDGKTIHGPWAIMCSSCHTYHGVGLGLGKGQKYSTKTLLKVKG